LQELAGLRLEHPDVSLRELGELAEPPLSKSAVYPRIRRLEDLAADLTDGSGGDMSRRRGTRKAGRPGRR
ncbi:MAG: DNA-binding protein WhiA, partial [Actinomycetota bacterium]|nr:DNA-binding protein WhiA [Actinomycetota bacterium]